STHMRIGTHTAGPGDPLVTRWSKEANRMIEYGSTVASTTWARPDMSPSLPVRPTHVPPRRRTVGRPPSPALPAHVRSRRGDQDRNALALVQKSVAQPLPGQLDHGPDELAVAAERARGGDQVLERAPVGTVPVGHARVLVAEDDRLVGPVRAHARVLAELVRVGDGLPGPVARTVGRLHPQRDEPVGGGERRVPGGDGEAASVLPGHRGGLPRLATVVRDPRVQVHRTVVPPVADGAVHV